MKIDVRQDFVLQAQDTSCVVNYVWINDKPFVAGINDTDPQCGIPLEYIDKVIDNARRYPDANFNIWLDTQLLKDSPTEFFIHSHLYMSGCENITLHDLNDIPAYWDNQTISIWHRVDIARLIVMQHSISQNPNHISVYADFDVDDVAIESDRFYEALASCGFAVGTPSPIKAGKIENSFFAFTNKNSSKQVLGQILKDIDARPPHLDGRNAIYSSFRRTIERHFGLSQALELQDCLIENVKPTRTKIQRNVDYFGLSVKLE